MFNLDKATYGQQLATAIKENDEEKFNEAFEQWTEAIYEEVIDEANAIVDSVDTTVLAQRGVRQLTSEEKTYYQKLSDAMRSKNPKQAVADLDVAMPETVIDQVFKDLEDEHPLLNKIDFVNTKGVIRWIVNKHGRQLATWDDLNTEIVTELTSGLAEVDMTLKKLSAFFPIHKDMLDLGPVWLDRYIRRILSEAIALGLEDGIINGTGNKAPIGMIRKIGDDVSVVGGKYPEKDAIVVDRLDQVTYGQILSQLAKTEDVEGTPRYRVVNTVVLIVNPCDYLAKVMPSTTFLTASGYQKEVLPHTTDIIQSVVVPEGKAILGIAKNYFMGVGLSKTGKIEYSDDYRFLEDERVYLTKLYGNGTPKDNDSFVVLDISNLESVYPTVNVNKITPEAEAGTSGE